MTPTRRRLLIALPILAFWLLMMGLLLQRELLWPGTSRSQPTARALDLPSETWMGIFAGQRQQIGYLHLSQIPEERGDRKGVAALLDSRLTLTVLGRPADLRIAGTAWRSLQGSLAQLDFGVSSGEYSFRFEGTLEDGELQGQVESGGEAFPLSLSLGREVTLSTGVGSVLQFPRLEVGDELVLDSFDPVSLRASPVRVRCVAREALEVAGETYEALVLALSSGGLKSRAWIDDQGNVLRAETPYGLALEVIRPEQALASGDAETAADFLELSAIRPRGERPRRNARRMLIALQGATTRELPEDDTQRRLDEDRLLIRPGQAPSSDTNAGPPSHLTAYLGADAFVQSSHPSIQSAAADIVGAADTPWQRALRIYDWVFSELEKDVVLSIPSALEVLENRRGDCNEHTVLFTALARAAELPARIAIGLVWSEDQQSFYYHAWPEVFVGRWIWMDPTLGQPMADASHIKLLSGGIESWPQLLPYLGRLQIEVLEVE